MKVSKFQQKCQKRTWGNFSFNAGRQAGREHGTVYILYDLPSIYNKVYDHAFVTTTDKASEFSEVGGVGTIS